MRAVSDQHAKPATHRKLTLLWNAHPDRISGPIVPTRTEANWRSRSDLSPCPGGHQICPDTQTLPGDAADGTSEANASLKAPRGCSRPAMPKHMLSAVSSPPSRGQGDTRTPTFTFSCYQRAAAIYAESGAVPYRTANANEPVNFVTSRPLNTKAPITGK
jgi:hypothetical protein